MNNEINLDEILEDVHFVVHKEFSYIFIRHCEYLVIKISSLPFKRK
jgi:hypothetical protein